MPSSTTSKSRNARCARNLRAEVAHLGALVVTAAVVSGCGATFRHDRLAEDRFEVSNKNGADLCALLYSAELTLAAGYSHFYAASGTRPALTTNVNSSPELKGTIVTMSGKVKKVDCGRSGTGKPGYFGTEIVMGCAGSSYLAWTLPLSFSEIHLLEAAPGLDETWRIIRHFGIRLEDFFVYDASAVRSGMRADGSADCSLDLPISLEPVSP